MSAEKMITGQTVESALLFALYCIFFFFLTKKNNLSVSTSLYLNWTNVTFPELAVPDDGV